MDSFILFFLIYRVLQVFLIKFHLYLRTHTGARFNRAAAPHKHQREGQRDRKPLQGTQLWLSPVRKPP